MRGGHFFFANVRVYCAPNRLFIRPEQLVQPGLVEVAHRRFAVRPYPLGMLRSQIVMNLLLELGEGMDRMANE